MATTRFPKTLVIITILFLNFIERSKTSSLPQNYSSSCGDINKIASPFRLRTNELSLPIFGYIWLSCEKNRTIFKIKNQEYYVKSINYNNYTIRLASPDVQIGKCSSVPRVSLSTEDISQDSNSFKIFEFQPDIHLIPEALEFSNCEKSNCSVTPLFKIYAEANLVSSLNRIFPKMETVVRTGCGQETIQISETLIYLSCEKPELNNNNNHSYVKTSPCINSTENFSYVVFGDGFKFSDIEESCQIVRTAVISSGARKKVSSYIDIHTELLYGFELSWVTALEGCQNGRCYVDENSNIGRCRHNEILVLILDVIYKSFIGVFMDDFIFGIKNYVVMIVQRAIALVFVIILIAYTWKRRHRSEYLNIEAFLRVSNNHMPLRYTYSEIKMMAEEFKTKLGEGGFGSVYKGKLKSGRSAAIKILQSRKSKDDGEDFINEVATIGTVHHVNVVRLVGFCVEGSKRALVYEFMPNGSLDKHIFSGDDPETNDYLSCKKMFEISLGIARGIEYLHRGCSMQILHFDIKPHNILLDENFVPKVSDFGLARLCPIEKNVVSLTAARGTLGYMAPELYYKNIGGASHKSDVYSFGMLLMEMANRRRNANPKAENSSQFFFPLWVHDHIMEEKEKTIKEEIVPDEEILETAKKMIIVGLWCIQLQPSDRPSMKEVIEMLEGNFEALKMPPKPCLYPQTQNTEEDFDTVETLESTLSSFVPMDYDEDDAIREY